MNILGTARKNKKIAGDMVLNIAATGIPLVILQILVYPIAAAKMETDQYALMISTYAMLILICDSLGKSINNIRLIRSDEERNKKGDYLVIVIIYAILSIFALIIGTVYYDHGLILSHQILNIITGVIILVNAYTIVAFRIELNYRATFINAVFMSVGFLIGLGAFLVTGVWNLVFLAGHLACFFYLSITTGLLKEPVRRTSTFTRLFADTSILALSLFLTQGMNLVDKLLLFPLLGGSALSVYYASALLGKVMVLSTGPINSVILSYLARRKSVSGSQFRLYLAVCFFSCLVMGILIILFSYPVLHFLYPKFAADAIKLVPFTTLNTGLYVMGGMVTPFVMKYCKISWQMTINAVSFILYVGLSVLLLKGYGIIGFCIGIGISYLIKLIILLLVYTRTANRDNIDKGGALND